MTCHVRVRDFVWVTSPTLDFYEPVSTAATLKRRTRPVLRRLRALDPRLQNAAPPSGAPGAPLRLVPAPDGA